MNRRQVFQVAASTAVAHGLVTVLGCQAETKSAQSGHAHDEGKGAPVLGARAPTAAELELAKAAADCVQAGEICLAHCLRSLSSGSKMMAECAALVQQMIPICRAASSLAAMGSKHLKDLARLCAEACAECAAECEKHAGHHEECKLCLEACRQAESAARALI